MRPAISIIVPIHNSEKFLTRCLDSLLGQSLKNVEIICVDDASTDDSASILSGFANRDSRIIVVHNTQNKGHGASRNRGLKLAQGEYVGFVDSDDFIAWDMYQKLYAASRNATEDIVKGVVLGYDNEKSEICLRDWYEINHLIAKNKFNFCYGYTSAIFRNSLLIEKEITFNENLVTMEDPYFTIEVVINSQNINLVDDAFYFYTFNTASCTTLIPKNDICAATGNAALLINKKLLESGISSTQRLPIYAFLFHMLFYAINDANDTDIIRDTSAILDMVSREALARSAFFSSYFLNEKSKYGGNNIKDRRLAQIRQYKRAERNRKAFSMRVRGLVNAC